MNEHTLKVLEFDKVVSLIKGKCLTPYGSELAAGITPLADRAAVEKRLSEVTEMRDIINFGLPFPLYRLDDLTDVLNRSRVDGTFLEAKEIWQLLPLLAISTELNRYDKDSREKFPLITEYLLSIRAFPELQQEIQRTLSEEGDIKDSASKALRSLRLEIGEAKRKLVSRLEQILSKQGKQSGLQDDVVTLRNERYVIGVPTSRYHSEMGILHDRSQSGATFYVEPKETVEMNNRLNWLYQEERQECIRILKELTKEVGLRVEALLTNLKVIGQLDMLHAAASFSVQIKGNAPRITDNAAFKLIDARHPLLTVRLGGTSTVIPNSISLGEDRQVILITGPNTGGKTILLKTIGLSLLLVQAGLHVAASEFSEVGLFEHIIADIGDEQSIELSLSTFSSHIRNIIEGLDSAGEHALLLFDEIGVGTDPREGSALAESVIMHALNKRAKLIVTTHYSQLKTLATEFPEIENASLEFDRQTLTPTYRLQMGIPGASYAVEIAGRLGMPKSICDRASALVSSGERSLDKLITSLEEELKQVKHDKAELSQRLVEAEKLESEYRTQTEHLNREIEAEKEKALEATASFLQQTRRDVEKLVADIRHSQAAPEKVKEFHHRLKAGEASLSKLQANQREISSEPSIFQKGDNVTLISLNQQGQIEKLIGKDKARVKIGNLYTTVELRGLKKSEEPAIKKKLPKPSLNVEPDEKVEREIHLRGMTVEEALEQLERFLDRAIVNGLSQVYVIHGKGAGILRRTLTQYLKGHPEVASLRLGDFNEGGAGVTIVKLKE